MNKAFPAIRPYSTETISVTAPHQLYVEQSGNPEGIAVLFVHGGPGGGTRPIDRCFFDPDKYRIILFDQRGSGQSTPHAALDDNNTDALVADIETLRNHLSIDRWAIFGGSWGSTLGLIYAQTYPERVLGLILRGVFLVAMRISDGFISTAQARYSPTIGHNMNRLFRSPSAAICSAHTTLA